MLVEKGEAGSCYNMQSSRNRDRLLVADSRFPHSAVLAFAGTAIVCILPKIQVSKTVLSRSEGAACGDTVLKGLKESYSIGLDIRPPFIGRKKYLVLLTRAKIYSWEVTGPSEEFATGIRLGVARWASKYLCLRLAAGCLAQKGSA